MQIYLCKTLKENFIGSIVRVHVLQSKLRNLGKNIGCILNLKDFELIFADSNTPTTYQQLSGDVN